MKTENITKKEQLQVLKENLQKDVNLILSDLEQYIVDSDDDFLRAHFDVDLVLNQNFQSAKKKKIHDHFSTSHLKDRNDVARERIYHTDFYSVAPKKKLVKNPFEKVNTVAKMLFSYL